MKLTIPDADTLWDSLPPQRRYEMTVTVQPADLDDLNHVNNTVYLGWCEQAARAHALSLGMGTGALIALGAVPVARQHVITYQRPARLGDRLRVRTALTQSAGVRSIRAYTLDRATGDGSDGERFAECQTEWVWVDPVSGRPKRTPREVLEAFGF
ncbi:thioesterase superfamily protein [Deinococcus phoenicis]|uniref:Thioesterase superfamily protein n=1 Tax=Deinococcus phoenicis TaxID=1476583 RepID=A0A016QQZ8_9DEIO|nr:thioesterase family protein [Deinococcus phoenicis]EYB68189.1 thioesterase superfamily protein [Deinococcus phoenicis]